MDRRRDHINAGNARSGVGAGGALALVPGKRTLTQDVAVQHRAIASPDRQSASPLGNEHARVRTGSPGAVVQKHEGTPGQAAMQSGPHVDEPVAGENRPGFIDNSDGANIRTRPAELAGSQALMDAPLLPATRVFVSGRHPQTSEWWYVTAFLPNAIVRGYVQGLRVTTDLPEPTAKLYQVKSGDTAEDLAAKQFSSAIRDGHDLRYYENVLVFVNKARGRAGVTGSYQDPGLFGGGVNHVQLLAGHRIWLVSPAYARALEGVVPDGSLTGGAVAKVKRFVGHIEDLIKSVTESPSHLGEVAGEYAQAIRDHMAKIIGIIAGFIMAEAASAFLAASPTGVGQIAAVVIQLGLTAFGAAGMVEAGVHALKHAQQWLMLAWTAQGREARIAAASKEFLKMLVSLAMAALAYAGVKGNVGKATAIADSMPTMMPAFAVVRGGQVGGASAGAAVATGIPSPLGPFGTAMAMTAKGDGESGGPARQDTIHEQRSAKQPSADAAAETTSGQAGGKRIEEAHLRAPAPRHRAASVKMKTVAKNENTVIEPGIDVAGDVAAIRSGRATRIDGNYVINGRTYGVHDGIIFPISGPGLHYLTRPQFKALGVYNEFGNTARAAEILDKMGIAASDSAEGLRVFEVIQ